MQKFFCILFFLYHLGSSVNWYTELQYGQGHVYSRLDLLDLLQGVRFEGYERAIDLHIKNLRAKIEPVPSAPHYIETVYGVGYRFVRK